MGNVKGPFKVVFRGWLGDPRRVFQEASFSSLELFVWVSVLSVHLSPLVFTHSHGWRK